MREAERLLTETVEALGARVTAIRWEGPRLLGTVTFPGRGRRIVWIVNDPAARAWRNGLRYAVGDLPAPGRAGTGETSERVVPAGENPEDARALESVMARVLLAFEAAGAPGDWPAAPRAASPDAPALLFGDTMVELRVTRRCNEKCVFCNTTRDAQNFVTALSAARTAAASAHRAGADTLVLSGGEPLLVPWLVPLVVEARALGFDKVIIQTNAVLLDDDRLLRELTALKPVLQVSLHAATEEMSDRLTGVAGLFAAKMAGIRAALAAGIPLNFNFVACRENLHEMQPFAGMVHALDGFRGAIGFSLVAPTGRGWRFRRWLVPTHTQAAPVMLAAMRLVRESGTAVMYPEGCGVPFCIEPELRAFADHLDRVRPVGVLPDRIKFAGCPRCPFDRVCPGVYRAYVDFHGDSEFRKLGLTE